MTPCCLFPASASISLSCPRAAIRPECCPERKPLPVVRPPGRTRLLLLRIGHREHGLSPPGTSPLPGTSTRPEAGGHALLGQNTQLGPVPPSRSPSLRKQRLGFWLVHHPGADPPLPAVNPPPPKPWTCVLTQATSPPGCWAVAETEGLPQAHSLALLSHLLELPSFH